MTRQRSRDDFGTSFQWLNNPSLTKSAFKITDDNPTSELQFIGGNHVDDFVLFREQDKMTSELPEGNRVAKIISITEKRGEGVATCRVQYYLASHELPPLSDGKTVPAPIHENELFRTSLFQNIRVTSIIQQVLVLKDMEEYTHVIKENKYTHVFLCQRKFHTTKKTAIVAPLSANQAKSIPALAFQLHSGFAMAPPRVDAEKYQINTLSVFKEDALRSHVHPDCTLQYDQNRGSENDVEVFWVLVQCLQYAVGNVVFTWDFDTHRHTYARILRQNGNGTVSCTFSSDGKMHHNIQSAYLRGSLSQSQALDILAACEYRTPQALAACAARITTEQYTIRSKMDLVMKNTEISTKRNVRSSPNSVMALELTSPSSGGLSSPSCLSGKKRKKEIQCSPRKRVLKLSEIDAEILVI